jgi:uncharacterized protein
VSEVVEADDFTSECLALETAFSFGSYDVTEDIEWIVPGEDWPLSGTRRGHAGLADLLQTESETVESSFFEAREFVAQGDRVLVVGFTRGKIIATNKTVEDNWIFAITVRNGKLTNVREYIDTQALARASEMDA